jgi:hypothetical protein
VLPPMWRTRCLPALIFNRVIETYLTMPARAVTVQYGTFFTAPKGYAPTVVNRVVNRALEASSIEPSSIESASIESASGQVARIAARE